MKLYWLQIVIIEIFCLLNLSHGTQKLPCHFADSKDITDGEKDQYGNIVHDGVNYTTANYGVSNEIWTGFYYNEIANVSSHIRGCICNIKKCVRLYCLSECDENDIIIVNTTAFSKTGEFESINIAEENDFAIIYGGIPCDSETSFPLDANYEFLEVRL